MPGLEGVTIVKVAGPGLLKHCPSLALMFALRQCLAAGKATFDGQPWKVWAYFSSTAPPSKVELQHFSGSRQCISLASFIPSLCLSLQCVTLQLERHRMQAPGFAPCLSHPCLPFQSFQFAPCPSYFQLVPWCQGCFSTSLAQGCPAFAKRQAELLTGNLEKKPKSTVSAARKSWPLALLFDPVYPSLCLPFQCATDAVATLLSERHGSRHLAPPPCFSACCPKAHAVSFP